MIHRWFTFLVVTSFLSAPLQAADYRVEALDEPPPTDGVAEPILKQLSEQGTRVIRGSKTTYCDLWLCNELKTLPNFEPTPGLAYPFTPGQLIGLVRFSRDGADFRDQEIEDGIYTLRYARQPVDGAHIGTSLTRDFLLLVEAEQEEKVDPLAYDPLVIASAEAAGSNHPCMLSLKKPMGEPKSEPQIRHDENHDWWIVSLQGAAKQKPLAIDLVIVGQGAE